MKLQQPCKWQKINGFHLGYFTSLSIELFHPTYNWYFGLTLSCSFLGSRGFPDESSELILQIGHTWRGTRPIEISVENSCRWDATQPEFNFHSEKTGWVCQDTVFLNLRMWWLFQSKPQWIYRTLCKDFCFSTSTNPGYQQFEDHLQIWFPGMHVSNFPVDPTPDSGLIRPTRTSWWGAPIKMLGDMIRWPV